MIEKPFLRRERKLFNIVLLSAMVMFPFIAEAQIENHLAASGYAGYNHSMSPSYEGALLIGIETNEGGEFRLGVVYRQLTVPVGHSSQYLSATVVGGRQFFGKLGVHIQGELRTGYFYLYGDDGNVVADKTSRMFGNLGVNYQITPNMKILAGYAFQDYNPRKYYTSNESPHTNGALKLSISYSIPLNFSFSSSRYSLPR